MSDVGGSIERGLRYVASKQRDDGSFLSRSSRDAHDFAHTKNTYLTVFFPSLIALALRDIEQTDARQVRRNVASFLKKEKSPQWTFNYWAKTSPERQTLPYPDDLDDTFCALAVLHQERSELLDGKAWAAIARTLINCEAQLGGPYKTWCVSAAVPKSWHDIDVAVNTNIGYFLSLRGVRLENINQLILTALKDGKLASPYYPSELPIMYFMARWYQEDGVELLLKKARTALVRAEDPHSLALLITTMLRLGDRPKTTDPYIRKLLAAQKNMGNWSAAAFCMDPTIGGAKHFAGDSALTTALCVEALDLYQKALRLPRQTLPLANIKNFHKAKLPEQINSRTRQIKCVELRSNVQEMSIRVLKSNEKHHIVELPWLVAKTFDLPAENATLSKLTRASLWGWMAYTGYDDVMDGAAQAHKIPGATFCLRQFSNEIHGVLPDSLAFHQEVQNIMDRLDGANAWELQNCRVTVKDQMLAVKSVPDYGDYWQLADRSLGHTISGLGVMYAYSAKQSQANIQALRKFFKHYLIARQLNDDAHDWEDDLKQGHVNAVAVLILRDWFKAYPKRPKMINLERDLASLRNIMWGPVILQVCEDIYAQIACAEKTLMCSQATRPELLLALLKPLKKAADDAIAKRQETLDFIAGL